jgi:hypothetical protein
VLVVKPAHVKALKTLASGNIITAFTWKAYIQLCLQGMAIKNNVDVPWSGFRYSTSGMISTYRTQGWKALHLLHSTRSTNSGNLNLSTWKLNPHDLLQDGEPAITGNLCPVRYCGLNYSRKLSAYIVELIDGEEKRLFDGKHPRARASFHDTARGCNISLKKFIWKYGFFWLHSPYSRTPQP